MNSSLIAPYKSIGLFLDSNPPYFFSAGLKSFIAVSTHHSYKIYKLPDLKIKLLGPHFPHKIRAIAAHNDFLYISVKSQILQISYYHIQRKFDSEGSSLEKLLILGDFLIASDRDSTIFLWEIREEKPLFRMKISFEILDLLHPMTYLNKILVIGKRNCELFNIKTCEKVYSFTETFQNLYKISANSENSQENHNEISCVKGSPSLHIIAIGFTSGLIALHNLKTDENLFSFTQENAVIALAFSQQEIPLLASSDLKGTINVWALNEKSLFSKLANFHKKAVNFLEFLPNELVLVSGADNELLQWKFDDLYEDKFRIIRKRAGPQNPIKKLRFFGEDSLHLLASSNSDTSELWDISLLNECQNLVFSQKINRTLSKRHYDTETQFKLNEILDFDFSANRAKEWGSLLTCHNYSCKPCVWSIEDHSIVKKPIEIFEDKAKNDDSLNFITAVSVTNCGNFAVLGLKSGFIAKINMESGVFQSEFQGHVTAISSLKVNHYNKFLLSLDEEGHLFFWDFFSGRLEEKRQISPKPLRIEMSNFSNLFLLIFEDFSLEIWDLFTKGKSRKFTGHKAAITEAKFLSNNKFVISASLDQSLKIWDVLTGVLINDIAVEKTIVSFDLSSDGEIMASVFQNSNEINLWHVLIGIRPWGNKEKVQVKFMSQINDFSKKTQGKIKKIGEISQEFEENEASEEIKGKSEVDRKRFYAKNEEISTEIEIEEDFEGKFDKNREISTFFEFTEIPEGKWLPLVHLDAIKEKNKPKIVEKSQVKIPFFLDLEKKEEIKEEIKEKIVKENKEKSRVFTLQKEKFMEKSTVLENFLEKNEEIDDFSEIFRYLKTLNPASFEFEFRRNFFGNQEKIGKMLGFFEEILDNSEEFDIKQVFFRSFLNVFFVFMVFFSFLPYFFRSLERI